MGSFLRKRKISSQGRLVEFFNLEHKIIFSTMEIKCNINARQNLLVFLTKNVGSQAVVRSNKVNGIYEITVQVRGDSFVAKGNAMLNGGKQYGLTIDEDETFRPASANENVGGVDNVGVPTHIVNASDASELVFEKIKTKEDITGFETGNAIE
ncbi:hypothetical protein DAPPUDRAFT_109740 [Daphnia pulex]|uniref:Uncharacterized protein n=1 Tax=Daphnia pulex TaxID=6669 RepID=E9H419_DAPPU|nr:hypothetical protein DAPPUDRAFT_109740 [Daphnia pulex]|eukprot:EFX73515.1 hypothetical protein DAPPUDRAFT_109740 [Daphnia pulex]